ncbi:MAG: hypothetical protein RL235_2 [Chlamydiota bacterium]|jgi:nucleoside-diphosphate-sugar epimerase
MAMRELVVITGASGRIGSRLARALAPVYDVIGLDLHPARQASGALHISTDITSDESVRSALHEIAKKRGKQIASFVHLAAYYSFSGSASNQYERITLQGTRRILESLKGWQVDQFVFSSTMLVHAPSESKIDEESPLKPSWAYPESKIKAEQIILDNEIPSTILRIAGCYDDEGHSIPLGNMILRIAEKRLTSRFFPGNLNHGAAFLHFDDLTSAFGQAIAHRKTLMPGSIFLIGEGHTFGYDQLQRKMWELLHGMPRRTYSIPKWFAKLGAYVDGMNPFSKETFIKPWMIDFADDNYVLDITKAQRQLQWVPAHNVMLSLPNMIAAFQRDPQGFIATL